MGQRGHDQDFYRRAVFAESPSGLLKDFRLDESKDFRLPVQASSAESFSVPTFHDNNCSFDAGKIGRGKDKWQDDSRGLPMGIEDEKINIVVFLAAGLANVLSVLTHKKFVKFEVFADDAFADGGH